MAHPARGCLVWSGPGPSTQVLPDAMLCVEGVGGAGEVLVCFWIHWLSEVP